MAQSGQNINEEGKFKIDPSTTIAEIFHQLQTRIGVDRDMVLSITLNGATFVTPWFGNESNPYSMHLQEREAKISLLEDGTVIGFEASAPWS